MTIHRNKNVKPSLAPENETGQIVHYQIVGSDEFDPHKKASSINSPMAKTLIGAAKAFDAKAIELAVKAHVRHKHTHYDQLLMKGWERTEARSAIAEKLGQIVSEWSRKLPGKLPKA